MIFQAREQNLWQSIGSENRSLLEKLQTGHRDRQRLGHAPSLSAEIDIPVIGQNFSAGIIAVRHDGDGIDIPDLLVEHAL